MKDQQKYKLTEKYLFGLTNILIAIAYIISISNSHNIGCKVTILYFIWTLLAIYTLTFWLAFYRNVIYNSKKTRLLFKVLTILPCIYLIPFVFGHTFFYFVDGTKDTLWVATIGTLFIGLVIYSNVIDFNDRRRININNKIEK